MSRRNFSDFWGKCAPYYDRLFSSALDSARATSIALAQIAPGQTVLEVGIGTGLTAPYYPKNCKVVGIDRSESMLKLAYNRFRSLDLHNQHELHQMDATQLEFADGHFDTVIGAHFLSATPFPVQALSEMSRVCKPGGKIILVNVFYSQNSATRFTQKLLDPITRKIGFSFKLDLEFLTQEVNLRLELRQRISAYMPLEAAVLQKKQG